MENSETSSQNQNSPSKEKVEKSTESPATTPSSSSTWWGGWISQAKEKSASVLEAVKNDLNEITTAVTETLNLVPTEEELLKESSSDSSDSQQQQQHPSTVNFANMKQSISSSISTFFGTVSDALIPQMDEDDVSEAILITNDDTIVLTGFTKHLAEMQANDETYLEEPSKTAELAEKYRMWLEVVEQDQFTQQRVDKMLEQSQILNEKYNKFVPNTVSHMNFFKRYLFKKALLEDELANEERRKKEEMVIEKQPEPVAIESPLPVVAQITQTKTQPQPTRKNEINDLDIANYEISEEEQARLLAEYEQEIKEREKNKSDDDIVLPDEDLADIEPTPKPKAQKPMKKSTVQSKTSTSSSAAAPKENKKSREIKDSYKKSGRSTAN
ncbi:BSD domain-containing protein 1-like isoform X3 [Chironomus tepperi]|uniref:BSD domain-containing protein 1-like isoform X3 n=1 Tax=Chironomus tepperi TaxID=113505 RepID=UPI00391EE51E